MYDHHLHCQPVVLLIYFKICCRYPPVPAPLRLTLLSDEYNWRSDTDRCVAAAGAEASPLPLAGTCETTRNSCEQWGGGSFEPSAECSVDGSSGTASSTGGGGESSADHSSLDLPPAGGVPRCAIAPGPIGAAHQMGPSPGYSKTCEDTPAEGSPYMWPLRWSADVETRALPFESDEVRTPRSDEGGSLRSSASHLHQAQLATLNLLL